MKNKNVHLFILLFFFMFSFSINLFSGTTVGSWTGVERPIETLFEGGDNWVQGFAFMEKGINLSSLTTSCTVDLALPVSGGLDLNGGNLYLLQDLILQNTAKLITPGSIYGNGYVLDLAESVTGIQFATGSGVGAVVNFVGAETVDGGVNSVDWDRNNSYISSAEDFVSNGLPELRSFSLVSDVLSAVDNVNVRKTANSIRFDPNGDFIAYGRSDGSPQFEFGVLSHVSGVLTSKDTVDMDDSVNAVAWNPNIGEPDANLKYIAVGGVANAIPASGDYELGIYSFNGSVLSSVFTWSTKDRGVDVSKNAMDWSESGSYLAVGMTSGTEWELILGYFDETSFTVTVSSDIGQTVNAVDFSPTDSMIAVGLNGGTERLRCYYHDFNSGTLAEETSARVGETDSVLSVDWNNDYTKLAVGTTSALKIYSFDITGTTLSLDSTISLGSNVNSVRWDSTGTYIVVGDGGNNVSVYKLLEGVLLLSDLRLFLKGDLDIRTPMSFSGDCLINSRGNRITLKGDGAFDVKDAATLRFEHTILQLQKAGSFNLEGNTSRVIFEDTTIELAAEAVVSTGVLEIDGDVFVKGDHTFEYNSTNPMEIDAESTLHLNDEVTLKMGKSNVDSNQPLIFTDTTSVIYFNDSNLIITGSGANFSNGKMKVHGNVTCSVDSLDPTYGFSFGDGSCTGFNFELSQGAVWKLINGVVSFNCDNEDMFTFKDNLSEFDLRDTIFNIAVPTTFADGTIVLSPDIGEFRFSDNGYLVANNMEIYCSCGDFDYFLTGSIFGKKSILLDQGDKFSLKSGDFDGTLTVSGTENKAEGAGRFSGDILLADSNTTLSWDLDVQLENHNIEMNGGTLLLQRRLEFLKDNKVTGSGTINLGQYAYVGGLQDTTWSNSIYWEGDSGVILLNSNIALSSTWTFSNNVVIDGQGYKLDLGTSGSLVVAGGSTLELKNVILKNLSDRRLVCLDNDGVIIFNDSKVFFSGDYEFLLGSMQYLDENYFVNEADTLSTFSYESNSTSTIKPDSHLHVESDIRFELGRWQVNTVSDRQEPLEFEDGHSALVLDGGELKITESGATFKKGELLVSANSVLDISLTAFEDALAIGGGAGNSDDDFTIEIAGEGKFSITRGSLYYDNDASDKFKFDNTSSVLSLDVADALIVKNNITMSNGRIETSVFHDHNDVDGVNHPFNTIGDAVLGQENMLHDHNNPHSVHRITANYKSGVGISMQDGDYVYSTEGTLNAPVRVSSGSALFGGSGTFEPFGGFTLDDYTVTASLDTSTAFNENIYVNGGSIYLASNFKFTGDNVFSNSGDIHLSNRKLTFGILDTTWSNSIYWDGDGAVIKFGANIALSATWTFSNNITIDGGGFELDLGSSGSLVVENGATLRFKNLVLEEVSDERLFCLGDDAVIIFDNCTVDFEDDYFFKQGSLRFAENNAFYGTHDASAVPKRFVYESSQTSTINKHGTLTIQDGVVFEIGNSDWQTDAQALEFGDHSSYLNLDKGELKITQQGLSLEGGRMDITKTSTICVDTTYGLTFGAGVSSDDDFVLQIGGDSLLDVRDGVIYYNNTTEDKFIFVNEAANLRINSPSGLTAQTTVLLKNGTINFPIATDYLEALAGVELKQQYIYHKHDSPFSIHLVKSTLASDVLNEYKLQSGDYFVTSAGVASVPITLQQGIGIIGGTSALNSNITVANSSVIANMALTAGLNGNITLNGGTILLTSDLKFVGDKTVSGPGTINLNKNRFTFGSDDLTFTDTIYWDMSSELNLGAKTSLSGTWTFSGVGYLNGHGNVLDLTNSGTIVIDYGAQLYMIDTVLKGLGDDDGDGKLVFMDDDSKLYMSRVSVKLASNFSTTIGGIHVEGPSTFLVGDYNWSFEQNASLTVDGITLWKDQLDNLGGGNVTFGSPEANYLTLLNSGTIKLAVNGDAVSTVTGDIDLRITTTMNAAYGELILDKTLAVTYDYLDDRIDTADARITTTLNAAYNELVLDASLATTYEYFDNRITTTMNAAYNELLSGASITGTYDYLNNRITTTMNAAYNELLSDASITGTYDYLNNRITTTMNAAYNELLSGASITGTYDYLDNRITTTMNAVYEDLYTLSENLSTWITDTMNEVYEDLNDIETGGSGSGTSATTDLLLSGDLTVNLTLDESVHVHPGQQIVVNSSLTISGNGAEVVFSNPSQAQFVVADGVTVTLDNVDLSRINGNTFQLGTNSKVIISSNVTFEFSEDATFNEGQFIVEGSVGNTNTLWMRGINGTRRVTFVRNPEINRWLGRREYETKLPLNRLHLGYNTLCLQNVEFIGVDAVYRQKSGSLIGSLGLVGDAIVTVDATNDLGFVVEGINNELRIIENGVGFNGAITFGDYSNNILHINTEVSSLLSSWPTVGFGLGVVQVSSSQGRAALIFDDEYVSVNNYYGNSFVVGEHSFLCGNKIEVISSPIKQTSNDFVLGSGTKLSSDLNNAIVYSPATRAIFDAEEMVPRSITALHILREKQRQEFEEKIERRFAGTVLVNNNVLTRAALLPDSTDTIYNCVAPIGNASGNIKIHDALITKFGIDSSAALNMTLEHDVVIRQDSSDVTLKADDRINVTGVDNKIIVKGNFTINGELLFADNAHLTFEFDNRSENPILTFADSSLITLEPNVYLEFKGNGTVKFGDDVTINLNGTTSSNKPTIAFSDSSRLEITGADETVTIKGIGNILVDNGAVISIGTQRHLILGYAITDDIDIIFDRGGVLHVEGTTAKVSLQKATSTVKFDHSSILSIGDNGLFEINVNSNVFAQGTLTSFIVDNDSKIRISDIGRLQLAANRDGSNIYWNHKKGRISVVGDGGIIKLFESASLSPAFEGRLPASSTIDQNTYAMGTSLTAVQVVQSLIQKYPSILSLTTVFTDVSSNQVLRSANGTVVSMNTSDVVISEDSSGNVKGKLGRVTFIYDVDGNRK